MSAVLEALTAWQRAEDPWAADAAERRAQATAALRAVVNAAMDAGDRDGVRVWQRLASCSVADLPLIVGEERVRLEADRDGVPAHAEAAWCPTCRTRRVVEEATNESAYEGHHEVGYWVTRLACGHQVQGEGRIIGSSPGGEAAREATAERATRARVEATARAQEHAPW